RACETSGAESPGCGRFPRMDDEQHLSGKQIRPKTCHMIIQLSPASFVAQQGDIGDDVLFEDLEPGLLQHFSWRLASVKSKMGSLQDPRGHVVQPAADQPNADAS